jgi:hypothetical protein
MSILPKERQYMVIVAVVRQQIQDDGRVSDPVQHGCGKDRSIEALTGMLMKYPKRCTIDSLDAVRKTVKEMLYLDRHIQAGNKLLFGPGQ